MRATVAFHCSLCGFVSLCFLSLEGFVTTVQSTASLGSDSLAAVILVPSTESEAMFQEDTDSGVRKKWEGEGTRLLEITVTCSVVGHCTPKIQVTRQMEYYLCSPLY